MNTLDMLSYFMTLVAITLAPGPVVLMLMVRSASNDVAGAVGFAAGYAIGGVAIISAVCFGLSAWLTAIPEVLDYSKYVMIAYMTWLAYGIWKGGFDMSGGCDAPRRSPLSSVLAGTVTCFISPYMMILFPLVLPEMMDITLIKMPDFLIISVTTFLSLFAGAVIIVAFAAPLRRLARSPRSMQILNRSLATLLVSVGGWLALA
ncbi:LysE family translocator [uncultured Sulfitobacter sp.]|uniref:LysE family translocator n=1 Tax=uncultured Sulfitobacter sp. TaxID=191468 RepID=UPI0026090B49|nr:LysE family translocator [uncultured Sulfitobacter sp.]